MAIKELFYGATRNASQFMVQHGATIGIGVGIAGLAVAGVLAVFETLQHGEELLAVAKIDKETIEAASENPEVTKKELRAMKLAAKARAAIIVVKTYWKPILIGVASATMIVLSFRHIHNQNLKLAAALTSALTANEQMLHNIQEEYGDEGVLVAKGVKDVEVTETTTDENGEEHIVTTTKKVIDPLSSPYSFFYESGCAGWCKDPHATARSFRSIKAMLEDKLRIEGFVSAADIFKAFKIDSKVTPANRVVGYHFDPKKAAEPQINIKCLSPEFINEEDPTGYFMLVGMSPIITASKYLEVENLVTV